MKELESRFIAIIGKNQRLIYKVCYIYVEDRDSLNDIFQDIMLNLWRGFPNFKENSSVSTWIYRVAINTCISRYRKERSQPPFLPITSAINLFCELEDNEELKMLYRMIEMLNHLDKAIILLYLEDKSYDEIGNIVGISRSNVGVRINRIKEKLVKMSNE